MGLAVMRGAAFAALLTLSGAAWADDFPPGQDHDLVARACTQCHDAAQVTAQHMTADQWRRTVGQMVDNGARLDGEQAEKAVAYLAAHFGPNQTRTEAQRIKALEDPPVSAPILWRMVEGQPADPRPPEKADDEPEFPGQTHAPYHAGAAPRVTTITAKLMRPWALAFLPDGRFLVTQRLGTMVIVTPDGAISAPLAGVPAVSAELGQGGLLDLVLAPDFAASHRIYFTYDEPLTGKQNRMVVARARLEAGGLRDVTVIFRADRKSVV